MNLLLSSLKLAKFTPPNDSQILLYVDDILVAQSFVNHFCTNYNCGKKLLSILVIILRRRAILQAPKPRTKKEIMSFLGVTNFFRSWISNNAAITAP